MKKLVCLLLLGVFSHLNAQEEFFFYKTQVLVSYNPSLPPQFQGDPILENPIGLTFSRFGNLVVANNRTDIIKTYTRTGADAEKILVNIPGMPTGIRRVPKGSFFVDCYPVKFIVSTEAGSIWAYMDEGCPIIAHQVAQTPGASYTGITFAKIDDDWYLYAADFTGRKIDLFDHRFNRVTISTGIPTPFKDETISSLFGPYDLKEINDKIYVTYAPRAIDQDEQHRGFVRVYTKKGRLLPNLSISENLDFPWGIVLVNDPLLGFNNTLLIGNMGNGEINKYDFATGEFLGVLLEANTVPLIIRGLWSLEYNEGSLYYTAGRSGGLGGRRGELGKIVVVEGAPPVPL